MAKRNGERSVREIEDDLGKDAEREGGYAEPKEPPLMRMGGALRMSLADQNRLDNDNIALKQANADLKTVNELLTIERLKLRKAINEMVALGQAVLK